MGLKTWFADQREQAKADPVIATFFAGDKPLALYTHTIRSGGEQIPLSEVEVHIESGEELQSRVTVTRLVGLGLFALLAKKKTGGERYLTVEGGDTLWMVEVPRKKVNDAVRFMGRIREQARREVATQA